MIFEQFEIELIIKLISSTNLKSEVLITSKFSKKRFIFLARKLVFMNSPDELNKNVSMRNSVMI